MSAPDRSVADADRAAHDLVDAERLERGACADDVDDRVERADLVELDVGRIDAVHRPLDLGQSGEDRSCARAHPLGELSAVEQ